MRVVRVLSLLLSVSGSSCAALPPGAAAVPPPPRTTVEVRNLKPIAFDVYVLDATHRIFLGLVPGMSSRVLTIPAHLVIEKGLLRFEASPVGSNAVLATDDGLMLHEGDSASLTLRWPVLFATP